MLCTSSLFFMNRTFKLILPRSESEQVDNLREKWEELTNLAANVRHYNGYNGTSSE